MLTLTLHVKPLLVNQAWRGRRFSTPAKAAFEQTLRWSLPKVAVARRPFYRVAYDFYLVYFSTTDYDGCIKVLQDCLKTRGIIEDDRFIVDARIRKFPAKADKIVVTVEGCAMEIQV